MLKINIVKSKNDQLRQGSELLISRTSTSMCPVATLENIYGQDRHAMVRQLFHFPTDPEDKKWRIPSGDRTNQLLLFKRFI